jgi:hypothetical protein
MIRAYEALLTQLQCAECVPTKHVLDNKISVNMKDYIWDTYKINIKLVPPRCPDIMPQR